MKLTGQELFNKLVNEYKIIGEKGVINFSLKDLTIAVETKNTVGNLLQEWLKAWMIKESVEFEENPNTQVFPDFYLDKSNKKLGLLEVKSFDWDRGPGFDLANFDSYCNSLLVSAYRLDSDYLIFSYQMSGSELTIKDVWIKKIWELACPSGTYPLKFRKRKALFTTFALPLGILKGLNLNRLIPKKNFFRHLTKRGINTRKPATQMVIGFKML